MIFPENLRKIVGCIQYPPSFLPFEYHRITYLTDDFPCKELILPQWLGWSWLCIYIYIYIPSHIPDENLGKHPRFFCNFPCMVLSISVIFREIPGRTPNVPPMSIKKNRSTTFSQVILPCFRFIGDGFHWFFPYFTPEDIWKKWNISLIGF